MIYKEYTTLLPGPYIYHLLTSIAIIDQYSFSSLKTRGYLSTCPGPWEPWLLLSKRANHMLVTHYPYSAIKKRALDLYHTRAAVYIFLQKATYER